MIRCLIFLLAIIHAASVNSQEMNEFKFRGKPINPMCFALFKFGILFEPSRLGGTLSIKNCMEQIRSEQTSPAHISKNSQGEYFTTGKIDNTDGYYAYRVLGKSSNNIYAVYIRMKIGRVGSSDLLFLTLTHSKRDILLNMLSYITGGDRCLGDFASMKMEGNKLHLTQYVEGESVDDCRKTRSFTVDVSKIAKQEEPLEI